MAATQNFNAHNEDMEIGLLDDTIDPDVEARLYGEIYYSNDTYPDQPGILEPPTPLNEVEPSDSSARDSPQCTKDPQPGQSRSPGLCPPQDSPPEAPQYFNRKKHRALIDGPLEFPHPFSFPRPFPMDKGHPRGPRTHDSSQRANRNDYPRENHRRRDPNPSHRPRKSRESPWRENPGREEVMEEDGEPDSTSLIALDEAMTPPEVTTPKPAELLRNNSKSPDEAPQETSNASSPPPKDEEEAPVNSKYKVLGKKSTKKILQLVTEISDSDDSILEVPVPPKPTPPLISLQDSDEESSSEEESSVVMDKSDRTSSRAKDSSSESSRSSSPEIIEDSDDTRDSSGTHEGVNLILNCTRVQKGVSSLAEIKRMRESEGKSVVEQIDEESMTESEAMNWGSLEGEMEKSQGETLKQLWQEFSEEGDLRRNFLDESGSSGKPSEEASRVSLEKTANEKSKEDGSRREKGAGEKSKEVEGRRDTPRKRALDGRTDGETPRKRTRQKENQDKEISFEEYLLQPMPKQLRDFYNEPRGGDIMRDIREIQNDMPKNPSRWMVLDSDIYPLHRKKHSVCSICQREGHVRSRCPNRPRAPTCHICGVVGHSEPRCPENKKCISCGKKYSTCRTTCEHCIRLRCSQCSGRGHTLANCPDNWRKYHQTTTGESVSITSIRLAMKSPSQLVCCHCIQRGHHVSTCQDLDTDDIEPLFEIIDIDNVDEHDDDIEILTPETNAKSLTVDEVVLLSDDSDRVNSNERDYDSEISSISLDGESKGGGNFSDDDDDEIEVIPYVKPPIPTYCISDDDDVDVISVKSNDEVAEKIPENSTSIYYDPTCPTLSNSSDSEDEIDVEFLDEDVNVEDLSDKSEGSDSNELIDVDGVEETNFVVKILSICPTEGDKDAEESVQVEVGDLLRKMIGDVERLDAEAPDVEGNAEDRISVEKNSSLEDSEVQDERNCDDRVEPEADDVRLNEAEALDAEGNAEDRIFAERNSSLEEAEEQDEGNCDDRVEPETNDVIINSRVEFEMPQSPEETPGVSDDDQGESDDSGPITYVKEERGQGEETANKPINNFNRPLKREPKAEPPDL
ncbi:uncharacterized protein LOC107039577 isoform X2 [Diachasma alloeum]|uniref:uncharacterized protein LOC107039577 isoform X2 n=1 Tax=Diachasma alloeum TaxID=454923 RepID=UPI0007381E62|nr:uncharacterized protein LOC107039577 isoform X2 [Diachasma alloeum]